MEKIKSRKISFRFKTNAWDNNFVIPNYATLERLWRRNKRNSLSKHQLEKVLGSPWTWTIRAKNLMSGSQNLASRVKKSQFQTCINQRIQLKYHSTRGFRPVMVTFMKSLERTTAVNTNDASNWGSKDRQHWLRMTSLRLYGRIKLVRRIVTDHIVLKTIKTSSNQ